MEEMRAFVLQVRNFSVFVCLFTGIQSTRLNPTELLCHTEIKNLNLNWLDTLFNILGNEVTFIFTIWQHLKIDDLINLFSW